MQVTDAMVAAGYPFVDTGDPYNTPTEDDFRAALTAALAEMWRPIEEAPKDGTDVWVMSRRWLMPCPAHFTSREYLAREYGDPEHMEEGWYPSHGFLFDLPEVTIEPTRFMPLPAPPRGK